MVLGVTASGITGRCLRVSESEELTPMEVLEMNRCHTYGPPPSNDKVSLEVCRRLRRSYVDATDGGERQAPAGFYDAWFDEFMDEGVSQRTLRRHAKGECNHDE